MENYIRSRPDYHIADLSIVMDFLGKEARVSDLALKDVVFLGNNLSLARLFLSSPDYTQTTKSKFVKLLNQSVFDFAVALWKNSDFAFDKVRPFEESQDFLFSFADLP